MLPRPFVAKALPFHCLLCSTAFVAKDTAVALRFHCHRWLKTPPLPCVSHRHSWLKTPPFPLAASSQDDEDELLDIRRRRYEVGRLLVKSFKKKGSSHPANVVNLPPTQVFDRENTPLAALVVPLLCSFLSILAD